LRLSTPYSKRIIYQPAQFHQQLSEAVQNPFQRAANSSETVKIIEIELKKPLVRIVLIERWKFSSFLPGTPRNSCLRNFRGIELIIGAKKRKRISAGILTPFHPIRFVESSLSHVYSDGGANQIS
jgi:hypothetical protein